MATNADGGGEGAGRLEQRIEQILDELRAGLRPDGGDLQLVGISDEGLLRVRLTGCHARCPMAIATLEGALNNTVRQRVPEITRVECIS